MSDLSDVSAYYAAYMVEHGYRSIPEVIEESTRLYGHRNLQYVDWIEARWSEFERWAGIDRRARTHHIAQFAAWLAARSVDHQARQFVEAA